jgi:hypothetical protein
MTAGQLGANRLGTPRHVVRVSRRTAIGSFVLVVGLVLAIAVVTLVARSGPLAARTDPFTTETQSLIQFRAGERQPIWTEAESLIQFRAGERQPIWTETQSLIQFRAGERDR